MKRWLYCAFIALALCSCEKPIHNDDKLLNFNVASDKTEIADAIEHMDIYAITEDVFSYKYSDVSSNSEGNYPIALSNFKNTVLLFVANGNKVPLDPIDIGVTSYADFAGKSTPTTDYKSSQPISFYTAAQDISAVTNNHVAVSLTRSLARLDLKIQPGVNLKVDSCVITNIADRSHIFQSQTLLHPEAQLVSASIDGAHFTATDTAPQEGFITIYESENTGAKAVFYVKLNGVKNILNVLLPERIERNKKYGITINSHGATLSSSIVVLPWDDGCDTDADNQLDVSLIDDVNSNFPADVKYSKTKDTIFIPSVNTTGILVLNSDVCTEIKTDSDIEIEAVPNNGKAAHVGSKFKLTFKSKQLNEQQTFTKIYIKNSNVSDNYDKFIVVVQYTNRTSFPNLNKQATIEGYNVTFDTYIDGMISNMNFTENPSKITTQTTDDNFNWLAIDDDQPLKRLEGCFKPNDADANGQAQASTVTIEFKDGLKEVFKFTRKRQTLPVVLMAGRYWTKYNMRGNSKKYEDQIGLAEDKDDIFDFLKNCTDEEYLYYAGANYKGDSQQGMYLKLIGYDMIYPEYSNYSGSANPSPFVHCPDGYQIPNIDEFGSIFHKTEQVKLPENDATLQYTSSSEIEFNIYRHSKYVWIDPVEYAGSTLYHSKIVEVSTGNTLLWNGTGHQYSATGTTLHQLIYATSNSNGHYYEFYNNGDYAEIYKREAHRTRVVRCIKSDVKHVI